MTMNKLKAALKKQKMKQHIKKYQNTHNKYEDDDDGSISSDDVDTLEEDYIGKIIEGQYIIIKYIGRGTFSRVWLSYDFINKKYIIFKAYFQDEEEEFKYELSALNDIRNKNLLYNLRYNAALSCCFENSKRPNNCLLLPFKGLSISDIQDRCSDFDLRDVIDIEYIYDSDENNKGDYSLLLYMIRYIDNFNAKLTIIIILAKLILYYYINHVEQ